MSKIKNAFAKVKPYATYAGIAVGGFALGAGGYIAYRALKGAGAGAVAEAVGSAAADAATAATDAVAAALRG